MLKTLLILLLAAPVAHAKPTRQNVLSSEFKYEVALGKVRGCEVWNKFGYNTDIDTTTDPETIWAPGGTFTRLPEAQTLTITSSSSADTVLGTGARVIQIWAVDANWESVIFTALMNGTGNTVTTQTVLGVNRVAVVSSGSGGTNAGNITITGTTAGTTQAYVPASQATTQQMFFFVPANSTALMDWLYVSSIRFASGTEPNVTTKAFVDSDVVNTKFEVYRDVISGAIENHTELTPSQPFVVGQKSFLEFTAETTRDDSSVFGRFSFILCDTTKFK